MDNDDELYASHFMTDTEYWINNLDKLKSSMLKFINKYNPTNSKEIVEGFIKKIKESEDNKIEWNGFTSIVKNFNKDGSDKYTTVYKITKFNDGKYLEFRMERV